MVIMQKYLIISSYIKVSSRKSIKDSFEERLFRGFMDTEVFT